MDGCVLLFFCCSGPLPFPFFLDLFVPLSFLVYAVDMGFSRTGRVHNHRQCYKNKRTGTDVNVLEE